jgi:hypothetical protein
MQVTNIEAVPKPPTLNEIKSKRAGLLNTVNNEVSFINVNKEAISYGTVKIANSLGKLTQVAEELNKLNNTIKQQQMHGPKLLEKDKKIRKWEKIIHLVFGVSEMSLVLREVTVDVTENDRANRDNKVNDGFRYLLYILSAFWLAGFICSYFLHRKLDKIKVEVDEWSKLSDGEVQDVRKLIAWMKSIEKVHEIPGLDTEVLKSCIDSQKALPKRFRKAISPEIYEEMSDNNLQNDEATRVGSYDVEEHDQAVSALIPFLPKNNPLVQVVDKINNQAQLKSGAATLSLSRTRSQTLKHKKSAASAPPTLRIPKDEQKIAANAFSQAFADLQAGVLNHESSEQEQEQNEGDVDDENWGKFKELTGYDVYTLHLQNRKVDREGYTVETVN